MPEATLTTFAFGFLGLTIAGLWVSKRPWLWEALLLVSVVLAVISGVMNVAALAAAISAAGTICAYYYLPSTPKWKWPLGVLMAVLSLGLFAHFFPGFRQQTLFSELVLSPGAYPTSLYWNFDKPLAGLLLMGWGVETIHEWAGWKKTLPAALGLFLACAVLLGAGGCVLRVIRWAPHWSQAATLFAFTNLFFVTIPEEAFFRGFVQQKLATALAHDPRGRYWSVGAAALVFGLCHFQGGAGLMLTATIAGLFYGEAYRRTGHIEGAILIHFLLNLSHFALFSYPALWR